MDNKLTDEVFEQLKGELEAIGLPERLAERRARRQLESVEEERATDAEHAPAQHVVPVSRGWLVVRRFAATDAELFADRQAAIDRACELARPVGAAVRVLAPDGRVEQEVTAPR